MYRNLEAELKRNNVSRAQIADVLGVTIATASEKLNHAGRLKLAEAVVIKETFFPSETLEYLFACDETGV